jgi:hypothetical protein
MVGVFANEALVGVFANEALVIVPVGAAVSLPILTILPVSLMLSNGWETALGVQSVREAPPALQSGLRNRRDYSLPCCCSLSENDSPARSFARRWRMALLLYPGS